MAVSKKLRALGLMSGSSLDGLDIAYCEFTIQTDGGFPRIISWSMGKSATLPYTADWVARLQNAPELSGLALSRLHADYGKLTGQLAAEFIREHDLDPQLIGSHGHTVFHYPAEGFTLQIGEGAAIAAQTGIATICDFRSLDIAHGGQGAPLAPLADALLLPHSTFYLNLGGIANITARTDDGYVAFDIGGANQILNALVAPLDLPYDDKGRLARSGHFLPDLARQQDELPYFSLPYPKSLDNNWVREQQTRFFVTYPAAIPDKLHTACKHIARQIALHIALIQAREHLPVTDLSLLASGGGAYNDFLLECIAEALPGVKIEVPDEQIVAYKEAALMALMGSLRLLELPNCLASVTGARYDVSGGVVHGVLDRSK